MSKVFISGSRLVSRLPDEVQKRLLNVANVRHPVLVGDANGVDKAVQRFFVKHKYDDVTIFCSGAAPRNNLGGWPVVNVEAPAGAKGFQFFAAKDRAMAEQADFGLMIWDGKSAGTILNALRILAAEKIAVIYEVSKRRAYTVKTIVQWKALLSEADTKLSSDVWERSTSEERLLIEREGGSGLFDSLEPASEDELSPSRPASTRQRGRASDGDIAAFNRALRPLNVGLLKNAVDRIVSAVADPVASSNEIAVTSASGVVEFARLVELLADAGVGLEATAKVPARHH